MTSTVLDLRTEPMVRRGTHRAALDSGARIVAVHDPTARNVSVSLGLPAGMRHEAPTEEGMLHLLEHMVYQDSRSRTASDREHELDRAAGVLGGHTHLEYTEFYETGSPGQLRRICERMVEQVFHPALREEQVASQIRAVALERATRLSSAPGGIRPWPHLATQYWTDHAHGHDGSGDLDLAGRATPERLLALHRRLYRPADSVMTVLTPGDPDAALAIIAASLSGLSVECRSAEMPPGPRAVVGRGTDSSVSVAGARLRRLSVTAAASARSVDLVGDLLVAEALKDQAGLDASAGLFGPGDVADDDLFVLVDDTGQGVRAADRLRALVVSDEVNVGRAALLALHRAETLIHDDERLARATTRDLLLYGAPGFASELVAVLETASEDERRARDALRASASRLANQVFSSLVIEDGGGAP
ncbi:insulinase family protein [Leifsonia sp. PS1209]|uniref:M16 family metallopeptidase n=1 Tax=Leifsonia sp. PS1209 TaxID=2724914 RepID=UPI001FFC19AC|nr:insulinase family protein [Leifsonia sp. PS1209]